MNEQAIIDSYNLFVKNGYTDSIEDFKKLIASNPQALSDSYNLFKNNGYGDSIDDYKSLMGLAADKKKVDTVSPSAVGSLVSPKIERAVAESTGIKPQMLGPAPKKEEPTPISTEPEKPYFTGRFGEALKMMDSPLNPLGGLGLGDKIDDLARAIDVGYKQGASAAPTSIVMAKGNSITSEDLKKYIAAAKLIEKTGQSDEMRNFTRTYEEGGKTVVSFLKALANNPSVPFEYIASSISARLNPVSAAAAGTVVAGFAGTGAVAGGAPGAGAAAIASIPWAIGASAATLETSATFSELLNEQLQEKGLEFNEEGVRQVLSDAGAVNKMRVKAAAKGVTIGLIDRYTAGIAGKVGAKLASKGAVKSAAAAAGGIEAVGGSVGEAASRALIGQPLDVAEIAMEGIAEVPMAAIDLGAEVLKKPVYKINGEIRPESDIQDIIQTATPDELSKINIDIKNDKKGYANQIQDKVVTGQIRKDVEQANPNVDDTTIDELVSLEKELKKFENNKTQSGKDRAAAIRSQIKTIQEDAIQEQAAGQVPVQPTPGDREALAEGEPQAKPEVITEEGVPQEKVKPVDFSTQLEQKYGVQVDLLGSLDKGNLSLSRIVIPEGQRGTGIGTQVMEDIVNYADENKVKVTLTPSIDFGGESVERLTDFYKRFGFVENKGDNKDFTIKDTMYREPQLAKTIEQKIYETLPTERLQPQPGIVQPQKAAEIKPTGLAVPVQPSPKRAEVKGSIERIANAGLLRSAETGQPAITQQEIDAQMELTDAMARVWEETTGQNNFYETFISDVKEGDVQAIKEKGGALFQNTEVPQRPISRVTLGVFELPEFQKMKGVSVAPQSISDLMKSRGKQIEKDIVATVLDYDKYKGQKRIPFDEFRDDVETQLMKLERIDTTTYASYGMDNLGDNQNYGRSQTVIFNSPIDHGQYGHFRSDFVKSNLTPTTWSIRQIPNTEQYVAIDANMPAGTSQTEMAQYIGTAGPIADVEKWVSDRNAITEKEINKGLFGHIRNWYNQNTGVYTLAELQSDYFQKNKANDLYASRIPQEEVDEYVNKNFRVKLDNEYREILKNELNIATDIFVNANGDLQVTSFVKDNPKDILYSASYDRSYTPPAGYTLEENKENIAVAEVARRLAISDEEIADKRRAIKDEYETKRSALKAEENKYIAKRIEEIKKSEAGNLMVRQFVASQKVHELRLFREALKHAAEKGATELWFPTPFTIATIEGYVSANGRAPYDIIQGSEGGLEPGDIIDYGGTEMIVVDSTDFSITVARRDDVQIYDIEDVRVDETNNRMDELEYDLGRQFDSINSITKEDVEAYQTYEFLSEEVLTQLKEYFENNPEEETVAWSDIESGVRDYVSSYYDDLEVRDLISWADDVYQDGDTAYAIDGRTGTERLGQPSEYESDVDEANFDGELDDDQMTVVKKYDELGQMMRKMRPDVTEVTDNNGKKWLRTAITASDKANPIIAFQEEGGKIKGAIDFSNDNKASIYLFDGADISTLSHEMSGHLGRRVLEQLSMVDERFAKDYETAKKWAGVVDNQWSRSAEEKWARGFEKYLLTGKAPSKALNNVFQKLRDWLTNIYKSIKGSSIDIELTPDVVRVFDNLLSTRSEQLMTADTKDATVLQKVLDFLDKADADLTKFGRETAGMNITIPVMKAIIKTVKALVKTGITLQEAIKRAAEKNNVTEKDVTDAINMLAQQRVIQAKPEGVSEMELPGYNRMIGELEGVIEKSRERGVEEVQVMDNAIAYLQGSRVYETASDTQREQMVRDVRKMFGKREKPAPKPEKLFGELKDVKMITMSDYDLMVKQISDFEKGAKSVKVRWKKTSDALTKYLKEMADGGRITINQMTAVLRKFGGVNMLDPRSIERFVQYMSRVFQNANYAEQIAAINKMLPTARKNAQTKIGVSQTLSPLLKKLFAINPTLIPDAVFDKYTEVVQMMGERKAVLELQESGKLTDTVEEILDAVDEEVSRSEELTELFSSYDDKVVDEEGNIDFSKTLKRMVDKEVITEQDAALMRKYKSTIVPRPERVKPTEEEIAAEKEMLIEEVADTEVDSDGLSMKDERDKARELAKLIRTDAVEGLDNTQLKNLLRVIDNINNGYFPHFAELMVERLNAINESKPLDKAISTIKIPKMSLVYAKVKSIFTGKDKISELIRREPQYYIDAAFGDFKTKTIFNSVFEKPAEAQAMFKRSVTELNNKLDQAEEAVSKSYKYNGNDITMSKFKMMTFMLQLEYDSNPDNDQVNPAHEFLKKTITHIKNGKSRFGVRDAKMLETILKDYSEDGKINNDKLYNSFNKAEKSAIKTIQEINNQMRDKAIYTAAVIRGDKIHPLNNYVHLNVLHEYKPDEDTQGVAFIDSYNNSMRPSTKSKSLIARTGDVSPLNFDVFASASRGAKFTLMDYYLTEPISSSFFDRVIEVASKQGYRAVLASIPRFISELSSNVAFAAIAAPKDFATGIKNRDIVLSADASTIMNNVKSKQTNRLFPHDTLSGRLVDTSILEQASGIKGGRATNDVANKIQQIYNLSLKKYKNAVEVMADALISTPDKMVMRPMWFGTFANEFKRIAGKDIDFDKVAANDELYMAKNKEALDEARNIADQKTVLTGATDNAFMGVLKGTPKKDQNALVKTFNTFNNFMTNFLIYEYMTARTGVMAAMGNGSISKKQGAALLAAVSTRMTLYTLTTAMLSEALINLFVEDKEEEEEKDFIQKAGQAIASSATSLFFGRDFGNATKGVINQGVEYANEKYLDFLRKGDYDPYKDAIQYTVLPPERKGKQAAYQDMIMNMMGPFGPAVKTSEFAFRKFTEPPKKEAAARQRVEKEMQIRLPLEVLGNLGLVPLYKDIRKVVNAEIYKELDNAENKKPMNKIGKEDMKRYFPDMYKNLYEPGGTLYDAEQIKKEMRKEKERIKREIKDQMYK